MPASCARRPLRTLIAGLLLGTLGLCACVSRAPAPRVQVAADAQCTPAYQLDSSSRIGLDNGNPTERRFDENSPCVVDAEGNRAVYGLFHLPPFQTPYTVSVDSLPVGEAVFAPELFLLDADGHVLRSLPWDRFSNRGESINATVFMNQDNADERYLVVQSAVQVVGQKGERIKSGSFFLPLINVLFPVMYVHGTESARQYVLSYNGLVRLEARSGRTRRGATAQDEVRGELGR